MILWNKIWVILKKFLQEEIQKIKIRKDDKKGKFS